jgi:hypothetical protein
MRNPPASRSRVPLTNGVGCVHCLASTTLSRDRSTTLTRPTAPLGVAQIVANQK